VYTTPFLAFFLKGQRLGRFYSVGFLIAASIYLMLLAPHLSFARQYTPVTNFHFLLSLGFYTLVAAAFDYVRTRYDDQLRQEKEKAEAAYLAKSRFLAAASHDLRQPAHALGMFVSRLMQMPLDKGTGEIVAGVDASTRALQEMLDVFFDYSRLEAQSSEVVLRPVALSTVLEQLGFFFNSIAAEKGLRLRFRSTSVWVQSDPVLLQRILLNLVSNALQYTLRGTVLVACRPSRDGAHLRIEVWDSGIGIAQQHHKKIFEEFFQVENQQRDRTKGLGLGLSMVARSCRLLNHPLQLRSELGCGSRFTLTVPLAPQGLTKPASADGDFGPAVSDTGLENMHILLIEDDALGSSALVGLLQSWGCSVTLAESAQDALEHIERMPVPDFVLSDFRLSGSKNGVEAIALMRAHFGATLKACLISGDTAEDVKRQASAANLVLLQKPVAPGKLRSMLRRSRANAVASTSFTTPANS
jgi:signal transduction histidine kinase